MPARYLERLSEHYLTSLNLQTSLMLLLLEILFSGFRKDHKEETGMELKCSLPAAAVRIYLVYFCIFFSARFVSLHGTLLRSSEIYSR